MKRKKAEKLVSKLRKYMKKKCEIEEKIEDLQNTLDNENIIPKQYIGKYIITTDTFGETVFMLVKNERYINSSFRTIELSGPAFRFFENNPEKAFRLQKEDYLYIYNPEKQKIEYSTTEKFIEKFKETIKDIDIQSFLC